MQVFVPYINPYFVAASLDARRLNRQIIECGQILRAISDDKAPLSHHPVVAMWKNYSEWLSDYKDVLELFRDNKFIIAEELGLKCELSESRPTWLTEGFCIQHRRLLYTKDPVFYARWSQYGTSDENWYFVDGELKRYINGKQIN